MMQRDDREKGKERIEIVGGDFFRQSMWYTLVVEVGDLVLFTCLGLVIGGDPREGGWLIQLDRRLLVKG